MTLDQTDMEMNNSLLFFFLSSDASFCSSVMKYLPPGVRNI